MNSRTARRLERLEGSLGPSRSQRFMECRVIRAETGEVVSRTLMPIGDGYNYRRRRTYSWPQKTYDYDQQTPS